MAFEINLSTRQARSQVRQLSSRIDQLSRTADQAGAKIQRALGGGTGGGTAGLKNIQAEIRGINKNLINMNTQWQKAFTAARGQTQKLSTTVTDQRKRLGRNRKAVDAYGDSLLTVSQKAAILRSSMLAMGTHVGIFTASTLLAATATFGLVKAMRAVITVGAEYTRSLAGTAAIIGTTRDSLVALSDEQLRLAESTKFTTTEVAEASTILAKTGLKTVQVTRALPAVLNLAAIGAVDMSKAADIAANAMFGFQLEAKDLTRVVDTLAFTATNSNTTIQQVGNALSFAAPVSAAAGAKFEEVSALLGVMADSGIKASKAGTTLRRAYVNLLDPGREAATVISDLGITIRDSATGQMRSLVDIMDDFARANGNAVDLVKIFGVRAAPGMIAIWKDLARGAAGATSKTREFLRTLEKEGSGLGERMRDAMEENLIDVWLKFTSVLSVKATEAFLVIEDSLISLVREMTGFVKTNVDLASGLRKSAVHLREWGKLLSGIGTSISGLGNVIESTFPGIGAQTLKVLSDIGQALLDIPINIRAMVQIAAVHFGRLSLTAELVPLQIAKAWLNLRKFFSETFAEIDIKGQQAFQGLVDFFFPSKALGLKAAAGARVKEAERALAMEKEINATALAGVQMQIDALEELDKVASKVAEDSIDDILAERQARLDARDAALAQVDANKQLQADIRRARRQREATALMRPAELGPDIGIGRGELRQPDVDLLGTSDRKLRDFIKLQKQSTAATVDQIKHLEKLKQLSPFEALNAGIEKSTTSLRSVEAEYAAIIEHLRKFRQFALDDGYRSKAEEYDKTIAKVTQTFTVLTETIRTGIREQKQALETGAAAVFEGLRVEGLSPAQKIGEDEAAKLETLKQAQAIRVKAEQQHQADLLIARQGHPGLLAEAEREHQENMLAMEKGFQQRKLDIQFNAAKKEQALWGGSNTEIFNLAESVRQRDLAGMLSHGIAALSQASTHNKKAFELSKKAKIAQATIATLTGAAEALKWGFPMGPIFAALIAANGLATVAAIKATSFGGGGSVSAGGGAAASASVPSVATAPQIPPASDALFNSTATGGAANTIDSSSTGVTINAKFDVNMIDSSNAMQFVERVKRPIQQVVQEAYSNRGQRGGPLA